MTEGLPDANGPVFTLASCRSDRKHCYATYGNSWFPRSINTSTRIYMCKAPNYGA